MRIAWIVFLSAGLFAAAPAVYAGDVMELADGSWYPPGAAPAPGGRDPKFSESNIKIVQEEYDFVYYEYPNIRQRQKEDAAKVVRVHYESWPPQYRDASAKLGAGDYPAAIQAFESAAGNASLSPTVRMYALYDLGRVHQMGVGDLGAAIAIWERFQKEYPRSRFLPDVLVMAGQALYANGQLDEARKKFTEIERLPGLSDNRKKLAQVYITGMKLQQAIRGKDQALANQALSEYRTLLGQAEKDASMKEVAAKARLGIGDCLLFLGKHSEALAFFQNLADGAGDQTVLAGAFNGLGRCLLEQDKPKEALIAFLRTAVLYDSVPEQTAMALYYAGYSYTFLQSDPLWKPRMKELLNECIRRFPGTPWAEAARTELLKQG